MYTSERMERRLAEHRETVQLHLSDGPVPGCPCKHCHHRTACDWCKRAQKNV